MSATSDLPDRDRAAPPLLVRLAKDPLVWILVTILALGAATSPWYLTALNIENMLRNAAMVGLLTTGMSVVLLTGRIDLSVAATMVFAVIAGALLTVWVGGEFGQRWMVRGNTFVGSQPLFIGITLCVGILIGFLNGLGVSQLKVASFIMTLVMLSALRGISFLWTNGAPIYLKGEAFNWISDAKLLWAPMSFWIFVAVVVALQAFIRGTVVGSRFYAIGGNETATIYTGIPTRFYVTLAFSISGFCAALAGVLFTARLKSVEAALAQGYELTAITVAVIAGVSLAGGVGSLWRVLIATLAFSAGLNLLAIWGVATWYQNLIIGVALLVTIGITRNRRAS